MHSTVPAAFLTAWLSTVAAMPAEAADVTPAQAAALQAQVQGWLQAMLGPDTRLAGQAVQVAPEGDHYRIEVPLGTTHAGHPGPVPLAASARPAEAGRWTFEGPALPSPARFTLDMPAPAKDGQKMPGPNVPVDYTVTMGNQESRGTFDPSFATASTFSTGSRDVQIRAESGLLDQTTKIERSSGTSTILPSGADRVDVTGEATIEGYVLTSRSQGAQGLELSAHQVRATGGLTALSRERVGAVIPAVVRLASGLLARPPGPGGKAATVRPPVDPQLLRTIVRSLQDLASEFTLNETFDGVTVRTGASNGAASQVRIGMGAKSEGGLLQASMDLGLDGLVLPDAAPGAMAELLPRRVALRPVLTGVPTEELIRWLGAMGDAQDGARPPDFAALFRHAGVSAGLDSFAVDVGGANFAGTAALTTASPGELMGRAHVTAANFDDLIAHVNAVPELAGVLPLFVFAKGISQTAKGRLVWDIAYRDGKLLVNGTDVSAMTGQAPARGRPGPDRR